MGSQIRINIRTGASSNAAYLCRVAADNAVKKNDRAAYTSDADADPAAKTRALLARTAAAFATGDRVAANSAVGQRHHAVGSANGAAISRPAVGGRRVAAQAAGNGVAAECAIGQGHRAIVADAGAPTGPAVTSSVGRGPTRGGVTAECAIAQGYLPSLRMPPPLPSTLAGVSADCRVTAERAAGDRNAAVARAAAVAVEGVLCSGVLRVQLLSIALPPSL